MTFRGLALALALAACTPEDMGQSDDPSTGSATNPVTPPKTTAGQEFDAPDSITVACGDSDNLLRKICNVTVDPPQSVVVEVHRDGDPEPMQFESRYELGLHSVDIMFMAPASTYDVTATALQWPDDRSARTAVTTDALPPGLDVHLAMTGTAASPLIAGPHPCARQAVAAIFDTRTGEPIWFQLMDADGSFNQNNMLRFTDRHTILADTGDDVVEVDLVGRELFRLEGLPAMLNPGETFWKLHHDVWRHDDTVYVMYREMLEQGALDVTVLLDLQGNVIREWYPWEHLDLPKDWSGNYLHTNTVFVDDNGDILMSWLIPNTVAKVVGDPDSPDFGEPIWMLVGGANWIPHDVVVDWSQVEEPGWFRRQHSIHLDNDGDLLLLDNWNARGLRIAIDEAAKTAQVEMSFPATSTLDQCGEQGTMQSSPSGNVLVGCAEDVIREFDAAGTMLWEADAVCAEGEAAEVARWYPLEGWRPVPSARVP